MRSHEAQRGERGGDPRHPRRIGDALARISDVESSVAKQDQPAALHRFVERKHALFVDGEFLVIGMQLDSPDAGVGDLADALQSKRIGGMHRCEWHDPLRGGLQRPLKNRIELLGLGRNAGQHAAADARPVHRSQQRGDFSI